MSTKAASIFTLFYFVSLATAGAPDIVIRNSDTVWQDTLLHSIELVNVAGSVSPRIIAEYSNSTFSSDLTNVPTILADLTQQLPSTRRLIVNYAASTYSAGLLKDSELPNSVEEKAQADNFPKEFRLFQNYPNPFNPTTTIRFALPKRSSVKLKLYDIVGREVATLVNKDFNPGEYKVDFDASGLASGLYIYRFETEGFVQSRKLLLLK